MANIELSAEQVPISALHADMGNARRHDARNLQAIKDSLRQFGQVEPLVVQASSLKVVGGNGRLEAMRELGWEHCQVVKAQLTDVQAAALGIALNRTGELAQWDAKALEATLGSIRGDWDLTSLGFDEAELGRLLKDDLDLGTMAPEGGEAEPLGEEAGAQVAAAGEGEPAAAPAEGGQELGHQVRRVQLFFNQQTSAEFYELADQAQAALKTPHLSDTVLECLRRLCRSLA